MKFYKLSKVLPKPSNFYKKKKKSSSSSKYAGKKRDGEEAVPVIQGGEDPNPITRCA